MLSVPFRLQSIYCLYRFYTLQQILGKGSSRRNNPQCFLTFAGTKPHLILPRAWITLGFFCFFFFVAFSSTTNLSSQIFTIVRHASWNFTSSLEPLPWSPPALLSWTSSWPSSALTGSRCTSSWGEPSTWWRGWAGREPRWSSAYSWSAWPAQTSTQCQTELLVRQVISDLVFYLLLDSAISVWHHGDQQVDQHDDCHGQIHCKDSLKYVWFRCLLTGGHLDKQRRPGHDKLCNFCILIIRDPKKGKEENLHHLCGMSCLGFSCIDEEFLLRGAKWVLFLVILLVRETKRLICGWEEEAKSKDEEAGWAKWKGKS